MYFVVCGLSFLLPWCCSPPIALPDRLLSSISHVQIAAGPAGRASCAVISDELDDDDLEVEKNEMVRRHGLFVSLPPARCSIDVAVSRIAAVERCV
jgi:hypothetical protein